MPPDPQTIYANALSQLNVTQQTTARGAFSGQGRLRALADTLSDAGAGFVTDASTDGPTMGTSTLADMKTNTPISGDGKPNGDPVTSTATQTPEVSPLARMVGLFMTRSRATSAGASSLPTDATDTQKAFQKSYQSGAAASSGVIATTSSSGGGGCGACGGCGVSGGQWVISAPGEYRLCRNLCVSASGDISSAIVIEADNVVLDLGGHCVSTPKRGSKQLPYGIVCVGHSGITIRNGCVKNFAFNGILLLGLESVRLQDFRASDCGMRVGFPPSGTAAGIFIVICEDVHLSKCITERTISTTGNNAGVFALFCERISFDNCVSKGNINLGGPVSGFQCILCNTVKFRRCLAKDCHTRPGNLPFPSHTCGGLYFVMCSDVAIKRCVAENLSSGCDDAHGFPIFLCPTTIDIRCCRASCIVSGCNRVTFTGAKATGFEIDGTNNAVIQRCIATGIIAHNPEDKQCAGFDSGLGTNVQFIECTSANNRVFGVGDAVGFGWAPDPRPAFIGVSNDTKWIKCKAFHNDVGFSLFNQTNGTMIACVAKCNRKYGLYNSNGIVVSCHACTECNPPITANIPNDSFNNTIQANVFCNNKIANIFDSVPAANNIYLQNQTHCC
jgi:hypothetical protein